MVLNILSSLILVDQKRKLDQIFPDSKRKDWTRWELRVLVLISITLQISLIISGKRRKHIAKKWIRGCIWCAYLLADLVATVALGILVDRQGSFYKSCNDNDQYGDIRLMAFWAPFLLLHLGGPDTITAYALADNELWSRHLLALVLQTAAAIYITLLSWDNSFLSFLTIPMLVCGMIKYGERTWVLWSADRKNLQDSFLRDRRSTAGVNYTRFMEEFSLKEAEGYHVTLADQMESTARGNSNTPSISNIPDALHAAEYFFETLKFKWLLVDLVLSYQERDVSRSFFQGRDSKSAFRVIEYELGFAYDALYTKAPIIYTRFGLFFRLLTSFITVSVLVTFICLRSHDHQFVDVVITYVLLIGAISLELYAALSLLLSDMAILWFSRHCPKITSISHSAILWFSWYCSKILSVSHSSILRFSRHCFNIPSVSHFSDTSPQPAQKLEKRWSHSMYQYGLLDFCLDQKSSAFYKILSFIHLGKRRRDSLLKYCVSFWHPKPLKMPPNLPSFLFKHFREKATDPKFDLNILPTCPGKVALKTHRKSSDLNWTVEAEFDHSILIWHIATDICYEGEKSKPLTDYMEFSKQLADYMLYLLVKCPFMLPIGIGVIRFQDTCIQVLAFLEEKSWASKVEAYELLGEVSSNYRPGTLKVSESVLFDACNLAAKLKKMGSKEIMWKMVLDVWMEILGYAAGQCNGIHHAQQLNKGGELLTHVWLLMAHLGLTKHFKVESHGRVKLTTT